MDQQQVEEKKTKYQNITLTVLVVLMAVTALVTLWVSSGN